MTHLPHIATDNLIRLCKTSDVVEGQPVLVEVEQLPALVAYKVEDRYFVTANECTHGRGSLSEGFQDGASIECPLHGGAFDIRTGAPTIFPCKIPVRIYPVEIIDDWVAIRSPDQKRTV